MFLWSVMYMIWTVDRSFNYVYEFHGIVKGKLMDNIMCFLFHF